MILFLRKQNIFSRKKGIPRNRYINEAVDIYNCYHKRKKLTD